MGGLGSVTTTTTMTTEKVKLLCAAITAHEDWNKLQAYLLLNVTPPEGVTTLIHAIKTIDAIGTEEQGAFKKAKSSPRNKETKDSSVDPDLDEN
jgi:hypothetical protein